jgi:hypothetical protein
VGKTPDKETRKMKFEKSVEFIINGVDFNCGNNYSLLIKFKEIQHKQFQYIPFEKLMKCSDCAEDEENN